MYNHQFQVRLSVTNSIFQANLSKGISLRISLCTQLLNQVITIDRNSSFSLRSLCPPFPSPANKVLHNPSSEDFSTILSYVSQTLLYCNDIFTLKMCRHTEVSKWISHILHSAWCTLHTSMLNMDFLVFIASSNAVTLNQQGVVTYVVTSR